MDYLDFDVELTHEGRDYRVTVRSPAGDASTPMRFPYDEVGLELAVVKLQNALLRSGGEQRRALTVEEQAVQTFGGRLFEALLAGEARQYYAQSRASADEQDKGLRLRLRIQAPELAVLPWEYLYDQGEGGYVCLSRTTPIVRSINLPRARAALPIVLPLRILGMIANPSSPATPPLEVETEKTRLERALSSLKARGLVELVWLEGQTWRALQQAMWSGPWHVFHFIGHGGFNEQAEEGTLALATEEGRLHLLSATHLGLVLADHRALRLVVLNACEGAKTGKRNLFSSVGAMLARRGIPAVVAMQEAITDRAAIELTRTFYEALAHGLPVDTAITEARIAINVGINNSLEWGTPVLYMRAPDGVLFERAALPAAHTGSIVQLPPSMAPQPATSAKAPLASALPPALSPRQSPGVTPPVVSDAPVQHHAPGTVRSAASTPKAPAGTLLLTYNQHADAVSAVAWSRDGTRIASASMDKTVQVWDAASGHQLLAYRGHAGGVCSVAWSSDGHLLASGSKDQTVQIWEAATGHALIPPPPIPPAGEVLAVAWSPKQQRLVWVRRGRNTKYWDTDNHIQPWEYLIETPVNAAAWSPDGKYIALADGVGIIHIRGATTGSKRRTYQGNSGAIYAVAWSPDGRHIASGGASKTVQVWKADGQHLLTYPGHADSVNALTWSPDGGRIASGSDDQTVQVWDAATGQNLFAYLSHNAQVLSVAWSRDGARIASASADKTVQVWSAG